MSPSLLQSSSSPPTSSWSNFHLSFHLLLPFLWTPVWLWLSTAIAQPLCRWSCWRRRRCQRLLCLNHDLWNISVNSFFFACVVFTTVAVTGNHCKSGRDTFVEYLAHICHLEKTPLSAANWINVISRKLWCQNIDRRCFEKATCKIHPKKLLLAMI